MKGTNQNLGDACSEIAYREAKKTFAGRRGMIGAPLAMDGGFTGALDMGDFLLVQNEDGVGTKIEVAARMNDFTSLGADLVAMVADDAVCAGAEVISISNTIDAGALNKKVVSELMSGLARACRRERIVIPGGEIAELTGHVKGFTWNATAVGIVEKSKFITGAGIRPGDLVLGIESPNFRSNGFTLLRAIVRKAYGEAWHTKLFRGRTWGAVALEPSVVYHSAMLKLLGRFGEKPKVRMKGIAHITGGGLPGNAGRMFGKAKLGIDFETLPEPPAAMLEAMRLSAIRDTQAYETWNMGVGMVLVAEQPEKALALLRAAGVQANVMGTVTKKPGVRVVKGEKVLDFT